MAAAKAKKPAKKEKKEEKEEATHKAPKEAAKSALTVQPLTVQPVVNIGFVGHVDHGKTTLTERLSGKWTDTHSEEVKRGITIRLGYANTTFYKNQKTAEYSASPKEGYVPTRTVSFVDAPGHESLMATMLAGATIMDGALLLVAANEQCPQPQTREHLMALNICGIKNIVIVQNKIDLVTKEQALKNHQQIKDFIKGTQYENAPIIPLSAFHGINISALIRAIEETIVTPKRDPSLEPIMFLARSFDINKPGSDLEKLHGGVLGGSLIQGSFKIGDEIELRPGREVQEMNKKNYYPIKTKIIGLSSGGNMLDHVGPGGSIALATSLDPCITKSDTLTGHVVGVPGKLPPVWNHLKLETHLLERVVGTKENLKVDPIKLNEVLMLNVNSAATVGMVSKLGKNLVESQLRLPVCAHPGSRVTISRRVGNRFRLIGYGIIKQ